MRLIAVDPGPASGIAIFNGYLNTLETKTIIINRIDDVGAIFTSIGREWDGSRDIYDSGDDTIYIVEDFRLLRGGRLVGDTMMTSRILGVLQWELPESYYVEQQPSNQWGFTPRMIRIFRENYTRPVGKHLRLPKITRHEVSAIKHLMYYMRENGYKQMQDTMRYTMEKG